MVDLSSTTIHMLQIPFLRENRSMAQEALQRKKVHDAGEILDLEYLKLPRDRYEIMRKAYLKCGDEKLEVKKQKTKIDESILKIDNNKNKINIFILQIINSNYNKDYNKDLSFIKLIDPRELYKRIIKIYSKKNKDILYNLLNILNVSKENKNETTNISIPDFDTNINTIKNYLLSNVNFTKKKEAFLNYLDEYSINQGILGLTSGKKNAKDIDKKISELNQRIEPIIDIWLKN